jgi:pyridoxal phosphate enzyme (YggS family)
VTKTVGPVVAAAVAEQGVLDLGESRPQELWKKAAALPPAVRWHLVGHLQRNKVERTLPLVVCIHSVDSLRLLEAIEVETARQGRPIDVLLEVNASREPNKSGFAPDEVPGLAPHLTGLRHVRVVGLMTMAALVDDPDAARPTFSKLRLLRDGLQAELGGAHALRHLSMGMSNDFEAAIEEGATMIRVGSTVFEGLPP